MSSPSSPVSRVYTIVQHLQKQGSSTVQLMQAISEFVGETHFSKKASSIKAYADLLLLIDESGRYVASIDDLRDIYLRPIQKIDTVLNTLTPYSSLSEFQSYYTFQDLELFEFLVNFLDEKLGKVEIDSESLAELKNKILEIKEEVLNSDLDENLKNILYEGISFLIEAIEKHILYGDTGIKVAFDRFFGVLKRKNQQYEHEESFVAFSRRILQLEPWVVVGRLADLIALADTGRKVLAGQ